MLRSCAPGHGDQTDGRLSPEEVERLQAEIARLNAELARLQGETPLMQVCVDGQTIAEVVSGWTGIPVGKMVKDEIHTVLSLKELLEKRIIGQSHALEAISQRIRTARAKLEDPRRPIGVFLLVGPSGVGKTETALTLADVLYGGEHNMVTINMSEYQEAHTVSGLKGSPPGYVGYGEGGVLTEAVRRKPYCVVLLDEMEKAHPDVMELFYQVFDKGVLEDAEGREIDFKNTVILLTSNVGTDTVMKLCADPETRPDTEGLVEALRPDLLKVFKPAFLGRLIAVPYYPITDDVMRKIIELQLGRIRTRLQENNRAQFSYDDALVTAIAQPLHRSGKRRAQCGSHPHADALAGDLAGVPGTHGRRGGDREGACLGGCGRGISVRDCVASRASVTCGLPGESLVALQISMQVAHSAHPLRQKKRTFILWRTHRKTGSLPSILPLVRTCCSSRGLRGQEGMSRLFHFHLDLLSEDPTIAFNQIVGQQVTLRILLADGSPRYINGCVSRFAQTGHDMRFTYYRAEVVPWLWFLTRTADCRIFQNMTVPDIILKIFKDLGFQRCQECD